MKLLPRIKALKIIAGFLFCLTFSSAIASGIGFLYAVNQKYFEYPRVDSYIDSIQCEDNILAALREIHSAYTAGQKIEKQYNISFSVYSSDGKLVFSGDDKHKTAESTVMTFAPEQSEFYVTGRLIEPPFIRDEVYYNYYTYSFVYDMRYGFGIILVSCGASSVFLIYFLICGAGRKRKSEYVFMRMSDQLPFDLYTAVLLGLQYGIGLIISKLVYEFAFWTLFVICPGLLLFSAITIAFVTTVAVRVKSGNDWYKNTLLYTICRYAKQLLCHVGRICEKILSQLSLVWKYFAISVSYIVLTFVTFKLENGVITIIWIIASVIGVAVICLGVIAAEKLEDGAEKIALGDFEHHIETGDLYFSFKTHADELNKISDVLSKAVDERTRSERFKAELITNVSHDIKTPLTSIINYVDLMKKLEIDNPQAKEYIDVLERQSARLKKLTIDLLEASKASSGSININLAPTDVRELLLQSTGEYSERIHAAGLMLELNIPEIPLMINADGRLLWRVFDNLLSNIVKYGQPDTRVYVIATKHDEYTEISFKNISRDKLNVVADNLTERFIRGDASRSTEGSGLGLSIAKSFVELQGGKLELVVDGDLFKANITFS